MDTPLSRQQLQEFRQRLNDRFYTLRAEIRDTLLRTDNQHYADVAGQVTDMEDAALADLVVDLDLADIDRDVEEIRDIDAALMRIAAGRYGVCIDCDEAIAVERLHAYPTAKRCYDCQQRYERTHMPGPRATL